MSYMEREITILSPGDGNHFNQYPQQLQHYGYDEYDSDPRERVDRARSDRDEYYRRVESTSKNFHIPNPRAASPGVCTLLDMVDGNGEMMVREKSISDGGPSVDSTPRVPEPHTSWRFYTSYDNGEWRRHAVPTYHTEEEVMNTSPSKIGSSRTESSSGDIWNLTSEALSPTFGMEASLRRLRVNRPAANEVLQNRRMRTHEVARRLQVPRSLEMIMNTSEYLPPDELKKRYEVKDYVPKRKTEYGERVIYPRMKSGSTSGIEMESHGTFASQRPRAETNLEEVTRTVHPSNMTRPPASNDVVEVLPANSKPINDYGFQEKVIIPTKYKIDKSNSQPNVMPDNESFSERKRNMSNTNQQHLRRSVNQPEYSLTPSRMGEVTYIREHVVEPTGRQGQAMPTYEPRGRYFSRSLDDDFDVRIGQRGERFHDLPSTGKSVQQRARDRSTNQEKEVKVVVIKNKPQGRPDSSRQDSERSSGSRVEESSNRGSSPTKASRTDNMAAQVRSSTRDAMRQMENQMFEQMKSKYPEAAEAMASLRSGADGGDTNMEKKEAFAEQVSLWQAGRPIEEKLNQETRYRSNDPISGPQDFVERSSVSRDKDTLGNTRPFVSPFVHPEFRNQSWMEKGAPHMEDQVGKYGRYRDDYSSYPDGHGRSSSIFYSSGHPSPNRQADVRDVPPGSFGRVQGVNQQEGHWQQQAYQEMRRGEHRGGIVPEKVAETVDKIIVPTKYQQAKDNDVRQNARPTVPDRGADDVVYYRSEDPRIKQNISTRSQGGGELSDFAAFISDQFDPSGRTKFDTMDGKVDVSQYTEAPVSRTRAMPQGEGPAVVSKVGRLGSVHGEEPKGEWEFDMAVSEIPRM